MPKSWHLSGDEITSELNFGGRWVLAEQDYWSNLHRGTSSWAGEHIMFYVGAEEALPSLWH
eukprot:1138982-Pelagomonas_calceolata.AAC.2